MTPDPRLVCGRTASPPIARNQLLVCTYCVEEMLTDALIARSATSDRSGIATVWGPAGEAAPDAARCAGAGCAALGSVAARRPVTTRPPAKPATTPIDTRK